LSHASDTGRLSVNLSVSLQMQGLEYKDIQLQKLMVGDDVRWRHVHELMLQMGLPKAE
jgi:hypothetical protein